MVGHPEYRPATTQDGRQIRILKRRTSETLTEDEIEARYAARRVCRHRGELHPELVACSSCQGRRNLSAWHCTLHDCQCVDLRRPVDPAIRWCHTCPDFELPAG